jgi:guanine nucleotide-binding protein G(i) subunit alpha
MDRDTDSLIVHRDTDSIVTATSVSSSKWSLQFAFDKELLVTNVYERWIRKLAKPRTTHMQLQSDTTREDLQETADGTMPLPNPPVQTEQNIVIRVNSATSGASSQQSLNLGERFNSLRRSAMDIELQPLKRNRTTSDLQQQAKESQKIDRNLDYDSKLARQEVRVAILGSRTRKRVVEEMRREENFHVKCYAEEQLCLFRPIILRTVVDGGRYLVDALQRHQKIRESDPIQHCLEYISTYKEKLKPDVRLSDEFATAMAQIMEHPATKTLMEAEDFDLPDNGK